MRPRIRLRASALLCCSALLLCVPSVAAPQVQTERIFRYRVEPRAPGDGAPIVHVPDGVPEPLFLSATRERLTVWWRVRHGCEAELRPKATVQRRRLTLDVDEEPGPGPCERAASLFETTVEKPKLGPWQVVIGAGLPPASSFWLRVPTAPLPKELALLDNHLREREALRVLGEHIAWGYYEQRQAKATLLAYRWLVSLDELHWRAALYRARIFESLAFTRSKGSAIAAIDALIPSLERLREEAAEEPSPADPERVQRRQEVRRELAGLEAFLEPAVRWLALRWHSETAYRWQSASRAYAAYLHLYPGAKHAPLVRFFYGSALLQMDDGLAAREQFRLAAEGLREPKRRELAAACALLLGVEGSTRAQLAVCRAQKPDRPAFTDFPKVTDAAFARPRTKKE